MKEKCDDKEWMHCRVEKMGCEGCHYEDRPYMKSDFTIIEKGRKAQDEYGHNYGSDTYYISKDDICALLHGKQLACEINGNEYSLFIVLKEE